MADALSNAVAARDPQLGVIFHTGGGSQYTPFSSGDLVLVPACRRRFEIRSVATRRSQAKHWNEKSASAATVRPCRPRPIVIGVIRVIEDQITTLRPYNARYTGDHR
jgi:hypothetical protein